MIHPPPKKNEVALTYFLLSITKQMPRVATLHVVYSVPNTLSSGWISVVKVWLLRMVYRWLLAQTIYCTNKLLSSKATEKREGECQYKRADFNSSVSCRHKRLSTPWSFGQPSAQSVHSLGQLYVNCSDLLLCIDSEQWQRNRTGKRLVQTHFPPLLTLGNICSYNPPRLIAIHWHQTNVCCHKRKVVTNVDSLKLTTDPFWL